jgi:tetratricopeptide (TPR) repeat protein
VERVLHRAEQAFHDLARGQAPAKVARRLAKLQLGLADIQLEVRKSQEALQRADDAVARYEQLAAQFPTDAEVALGLARATFLAGRVRIETGPANEAGQLLERADKLFRQRVAEQAGDDDLLSERLDALGWWLVALRMLDREDEVVPLEQGLLDQRRALAERPDAKALWLVRYGSSLEKRGDQQFARARAAQAVEEPVAPLVFLPALYGPLVARARLDIEEHVAAAHRHYRQAIDLYQAAVAKEGWKIRYQERLVEATLSDAETYRLVNQPAELGKRARAIEAHVLALHAANPANRRLFRDVLRVRQDQATALEGEGDSSFVLRQRRQIYSGLLELVRQELARDPTFTDWLGDQANMAFAVGEMSRKLHEQATAVAAYAEALEASEKRVERTPELSFLWEDYVGYAEALANAQREMQAEALVRSTLERGLAFARRHNRGDVVAKFETMIAGP